MAAGSPISSRFVPSYIRDSGHPTSGKGRAISTLNKVNRSARAEGPKTASPLSLENLAGFPTPKEQVERGHRNPNGIRESLHARLDSQISVRGRRGRRATDHAMPHQVPQDVTVEDREAVPSADVPEEMASLLPSEAVDLADEPGPRALRVHEPVEALAEDRARGREEPVPCSDDIGRLVVVEPSTRLEEPGHFTMATGPEEPVVRERSDRCIGGPRPPPDRAGAKEPLPQQRFVPGRSHPAEFCEAVRPHAPR